MKIVSLSELRANIAKHFDEIENDHDELIVTRQNREPMVVMSLADFESWKETMHLLASPANRDRLLQSMKELDDGRGTPRTMDELVAAARR